jgi:hypothetical protein
MHHHGADRQVLPVVEHIPADDAEQPDRELRRHECEQVARGAQTVGKMPAGKTSAPEPGHEGRHNQRRRVHVCADRQDQQPLPHNLVDQCGEPGDEERERREQQDHRRLR